MWFTDERGNKVNTENRKPGISANQFHKKEDDVVGVTVEELQHIEENGFTGFDVQEGEKVHVTENIEFHDDFGKNGEIVAVSGEHDGHQVFAILGKAEEGENPVAEIENRVEEQITPKTGEEVPVEQHVSGTVQNEVHYPLLCAFCTFKTDSEDALTAHKQQTGHFSEQHHEKMSEKEAKKLLENLKKEKEKLEKDMKDDARFLEEDSLRPDDQESFNEEMLGKIEKLTTLKGKIEILQKIV